jgi:hypothetical protein
VLEELGKLEEPSDLGLALPLMDRVAMMLLREDSKSSDRVKRMKALAVVLFEKRVSPYQEQTKSSLKLIYEACRLFGIGIANLCKECHNDYRSQRVGGLWIAKRGGDGKRVTTPEGG